MPKIKVAIVEDTDDIREALQMIVISEADMQCNHVFSNGADAMKHLPLLPPDVVLMDINLGDINGIDCVRHLRMLCPNTQFLMCTVYEDDEFVFEALKAGATGYITKKTSAEKILEAIREVRAGGSPMSPSIARKVIASFSAPHSPRMNKHAEELSERERELLQMLSEGLRYKEIADRLSISLDTVKTHCQNIYRKLQVQSRTDAINKVFH